MNPPGPPGQRRWFLGRPPTAVICACSPAWEPMPTGPQVNGWTNTQASLALWRMLVGVRDGSGWSWDSTAFR